MGEKLGKKCKGWKSKDKWEPTEKDIEDIQYLAGIGLKEDELAGFLRVSESQFQVAEKKNAALFKSLKRGRVEALINVSKSAYDQAVSRECPGMTRWWLEVFGGRRAPQQIQVSGIEGAPPIAHAETSEKEIEARRVRVKARLEKMRMLEDAKK